MIQFYCILLLRLLCRSFGIAKNYALFGVKFVSLKFGWCKENDILQVWLSERDRGQRSKGRKSSCLILDSSKPKYGRGFTTEKFKAAKEVQVGQNIDSLS